MITKGRLSALEALTVGDSERASVVGVPDGRHTIEIVYYRVEFSIETRLIDFFSITDILCFILTINPKYQNSE